MSQSHALLPGSTSTNQSSTDAYRTARGFTLVELLAVIGIISVLIAMLLPAMSRVRSAASVTRCASNQHQIGAALTQYFSEWHHLPVRPDALATANPHVFKYQDQPTSVADLMQQYTRSRAVFYCPANTLGRTADTWWPYASGTIAGTYQYPFWLSESLWLIPMPDYRRLTSDRLVAADYLGVTINNSTQVSVVAWNHEKAADGSPRGMNMLFGDGHVEWRRTDNGWQMYGVGSGGIYWYYAKP